MKTYNLDSLTITKNELNSIIKKNMDKPIYFIIEDLKKHFSNIKKWSNIKKLNIF